VRFPGSFGSAYLCFLVPKIVLFREAHSRRSLVRRVDFISARERVPRMSIAAAAPRRW
jgi:glutaconate CoA-transferase subunit B